MCSDVLVYLLSSIQGCHHSVRVAPFGSGVSPSHVATSNSFATDEQFAAAFDAAFDNKPSSGNSPHFGPSSSSGMLLSLWVQFLWAHILVICDGSRLNRLPRQSSELGVLLARIVPLWSEWKQFTYRLYGLAVAVRVLGSTCSLIAEAHNFSQSFSQLMFIEISSKD